MAEGHLKVMVSHKLVRFGSGCPSRINQMKGPTEIDAQICVSSVLHTNSDRSERVPVTRTVTA